MALVYYTAHVGTRFYRAVRDKMVGKASKEGSEGPCYYQLLTIKAYILQ